MQNDGVLHSSERSHQCLPNKIWTAGFRWLYVQQLSQENAERTLQISSGVGHCLGVEILCRFSASLLLGTRSVIISAGAARSDAM